MSVEYFKKKGTHHGFFRSQYKEKDWDEEWNQFDLMPREHDWIHNPGLDYQVKAGKLLDKRCKEIAIKRYKGKHKAKLLKIFRERYGFMPDM